MKKKRNMILMIGMLSMMIFSIIVALMMYLKSEQTQNQSETMVNVYVAKHAIHKGDKIALDAIELRQLPSSYAGNGSLSMSEVVGRYARSEISHNDLIVEEKLSLTAEETSVSDNEPIYPVSSGDFNSSIGYDRIMIPLIAFKNIDSSLKSGDRIDIMSVIQTGEEKKTFSSRYIALNVLVTGYKRNQSATHTEEKGSDNAKEKELSAQHDEIILEMSAQDINRFLTLYYHSQELNQNRSYNPDNLFQGHLWVVKCNGNVSAESQAYKKRLMEGALFKEGKIPKPLPKVLPKLVKESHTGYVSYEQ